jgi:hypothetical protein
MSGTLDRVAGKACRHGRFQLAAAAVPATAMPLSGRCAHCPYGTQTAHHDATKEPR